MPRQPARDRKSKEVFLFQFSYLGARSAKYNLARGSAFAKQARFSEQGKEDSPSQLASDAHHLLSSVPGWEVPGRCAGRSWGRKGPTLPAPRASSS